MKAARRLLDKFLTGASFPRYLVVGVFTSALDLSLFSLQSVLLHIPEVPANIVSTIITVCVSYLINRRFVFRAERSTWATFFSFAGVTLVTGLLLQSAVIWGLVRLAALATPGLSDAIVLPAVKIAAMGIGALCNYFGYRLVFRLGGTAPEKQQR